MKALITQLANLEKHFVMAILDFLLKAGMHEPVQSVYKQNFD